VEARPLGGEKMGKRVCFLVSEHPFLDARIFKKEAKSLVKHGYEVSLIVPKRNGYLFDIDNTPFKNRYLEEQFIHEGINIITYEQTNRSGQWKHYYNQLKMGKINRSSHPLIELGKSEQADIYHAHELDSLFAGVNIKRELAKMGKQVKLIYDSHELDPDPSTKEAHRIKQVKLDLLKQMLKETDYCITVSPSIKSWFHCIAPDVVTEIIYNSPPLTPFYKSDFKRKKELTLVYEGVMNSKRGSFHKLMKIIELCNQHFPLNVIIIGGNKKSEDPLTPPHHLRDRVKQTGWIPYDSIPQIMNQADLGWVDLDANESLNNRYAMPNKFFSYLNNGLPVITNECQDMMEFIRIYQCGVIVEGRDATAEDYVSVLLHLNSNRKLIREMSKNARGLMETQYSWEQMEKRLLTIYQRLLR
jgi:glycosyltransferase involved in cell wall biosynthesis